MWKRERRGSETGFGTKRGGLTLRVDMEIERRMMSIRFEYRHWCVILARNAVGQTLKNFFICKNEKKYIKQNLKKKRRNYSKNFSTLQHVVD